MKPLVKNNFIFIFSCIALLSTFNCLSQTYPNKQPVRVIVPFAAGGPNDVVARVLVKSLTLSTDQSFVVDVRPGAGGIIGTDLVAKSNPDGYTLGIASGPFAMNPALHISMPYDIFKDFIPITEVAESPMILMVPNSSPFNSLRDVINYAKQNPNKLTYGSGGIGSTPHLTTELVGNEAGIKLLHIPYKGGGESIKGLMGGEIDILIDSITSSYGAISSGRIKVIGVSQISRLTSMPDVPTFDESGLPKFTTSHWIGVVAPAKTPPAIIKYLQQQISSALQSQDLRQSFMQLGASPIGDSSENFKKFIATEAARWQKIVEYAKIKTE